MSIPEYYLGIDGGGTKTEAVIVDKDMTVLGSGRADGSNLHNFPIDIAMEHIRIAVNGAQANMCANHGPVSSFMFSTSCLGLAGLDTIEDRHRITRFFSDNAASTWPIQTQQLLVGSDGLVGLKSGTDKKWGVCLISSTGSNCYGINDKNQEASAGDWGHLLGDQGSSYAIGLKLIRILMKEFDGRRKTSILTQKVLTHLKMKSIPELVSFVYSGQPPVKTIASLSHLYADPELAENEDMLRMIRSCGGELITAYQAVTSKLEIGDEPFPVIFVGGLFNLTKQLTDIVTTRIKKITPQVDIVIPQEKPAMGAAKLAVREESARQYPETILTRITN